MFKKKWSKLTYIEEQILLLAIIVLSISLLIFPFKVEKVVNNISTKKMISMENYVYAGQIFSEYQFDNNIGEKTYINNSKYESHYINLENGNENDFYALIKSTEKENFQNKIKNLLLLKYPSKIVDVLLTSESNYLFKNNELVINFYVDTEVLNTSKEFYITINYNEIKDYLNFTPNLDSEYTNEDGHNYDASKVSVVLSFDDGPNGQRTKTIIDALEDYKMSATFFIVGNKITNYEDTVKYVYASHSEMGYHSYAHSYMSKQSISALKNDFMISDNLYNNITGDHFKLTRPPYGAYNANVLNSLDTPFLRWSIDTNDWKYKDKNHIVNEVLNNYEDGSIILCHDSYDTTVEATLELIYNLYLKDVQVLSVSDFAALRGINLENHSVYYNF